MSEQFEKNLLMEMEGLDRLAKAFPGIDLILERILDEYGDYLDPNLVFLVEMVRYDLNITLQGVVKIEGVKIDGILRQLEDVADEVQTFQAGKKTKGGVPDEDCEDDSG